VVDGHRMMAELQRDANNIDNMVDFGHSTSASNRQKGDGTRENTRAKSTTVGPGRLKS
jgi:hypothetical protein